MHSTLFAPLQAQTTGSIDNYFTDMHLQSSTYVLWNKKLYCLKYSMYINALWTVLQLDLPIIKFSFYHLPAPGILRVDDTNWFHVTRQDGWRCVETGVPMPWPIVTNVSANWRHTKMFQHYIHHENQTKKPHNQYKTCHKTHSFADKTEQ